MKKLSLIITAAAAVFTMQACHNSATSTTTTDSTVTKTDETKTDTSKMAMADTADASFATKAAIGGMTEIELSKVAAQKTTNTKIKDFANMMITDHTAAGNKLADIAKSKNIPLPAEPDSAHKTVIATISAKTGKDFDKAYVDQMVIDHKMTIDMFKQCETMVKDTAFKGFITTTLPTIQHHYDAIKALKSGM
jgi:putative membrane protein